MTIDTTNPHHFVYKTEELFIELLGGLRIDTLDRMRVTIKVTVVNRGHTVYLNTQVEQFVRKVAEKLELIIGRISYATDIILIILFNNLSSKII